MSNRNTHTASGKDVPHLHPLGWHRWWESALPLDSSSLFVVDYSGYGLTKLCLTHYKNLLVWDTHITVLLTVPSQNYFGLEGPCDTVSLLSHPCITCLEIHTKANCPRASVIFVRKPTWIQNEKMQTTGCLQRYSPSIPHTAQTEDRCLWRLHLPDVFYSSQFKLTYCSHLLRESEKREDLKAWSVSTTLGCPSQRATAHQHLGKPLLLMGDGCPQRRLLRATAFQGWNPPQTHKCCPTCLQPEMKKHTEDTQSVMDSENVMLSHSTHCTSLSPAYPGRRGHMAPGPKHLHSKEQVSPEPGLNQGEWIKATQPALSKRHLQRTAPWVRPRRTDPTVDKL